MAKIAGPESKTCAHCGARYFRDKRNTWAHWAKAKFCSRPCSARNQAARTAAARPSFREGFEKWIDKSGRCWEWTGARDKDGYGIFSYEGKTYRAARTALKLDGRPVPRGHYACHHCDNPACVRPDHLYPGTPSENSADMVQRGRTSRGEARRNTKLVETEVLAIRATRGPARIVAAKFGVSPANIDAIRARKTWKHLP